LWSHFNCSALRPNSLEGSRTGVDIRAFSALLQYWCFLHCRDDIATAPNKSPLEYQQDAGCKYGTIIRRLRAGQ
jgi:hypothetical protein